MNISIIENGKEIRQAFIEKFTITWENFQVRNKEWIDTLAAKNYTITYEERYLWELMDYRVISFSKSLEFLRSMQGEVFFMSENESNPNCRGIDFDGVEYKGCVAKMDAAALADIIEFEWNEGWRLSVLDMYLTHTVLPEDIYVFDASMEHLLVFTHENDYWELELEQPMKAAASRFCKMYGFELPESVTYDQIRSMLEIDLEQSSLFEIEVFCSCSMCTRPFTVSKLRNEDDMGYKYLFDFDPNTDYPTWAEAENAKVFNNISLREVSELKGVRFDIM